MSAVVEFQTAGTWPQHSLGELCDIIIGRTPRRDTPRFWNGQYPWVTISDLNGEIVATTKEGITTAALSESGIRLIPKGTLLFSFKLTIGKMAFAGVDLYTNEAIAAVIPKRDAELDKNYLRFALDFIDPISGSSHAVKGKTLNQVSLRAIKIPLPPLEEQKRIAARLTDQLAVVERARRASEARLEAARVLLSAQLRETFAGVNSNLWPTMRLEDAANLKRGRFSHRPRNDPKYYGGSYPWIQTSEVESASKYIKSYSATLNERGLAVSKLFPKGTLVLTIAATIGAVAILDFDSCMPDSVVAVQPRDGVCETEYLYFLLLFLRKNLESFAPKMAQANLKLELLNPLQIPVPNLRTQRLLVAKLNTVWTIQEKVEAECTDELSAIESLRGSLLRQTFTGTR